MSQWGNFNPQATTLLRTGNQNFKAAQHKLMMNVYGARNPKYPD